MAQLPATVTAPPPAAADVAAALAALTAALGRPAPMADGLARARYAAVHIVVSFVVVVVAVVGVADGGGDLARPGVLPARAGGG